MTGRPCECRRAKPGPYSPGQCYLCWLALNTAEYGPAWGGVAPADPQPIPGREGLPARPPGGPGTELKKLLSSLGIVDMVGCGCDDYAAELDRNGPAWCREHANEIADRLRERAAEVGWGVRLGAAVRAVSMGLVLNPLDPYPGLVEEAVRRAEEIQAQT